MEENETSSGKRLSTPILVGFVVVIALILVGLFLPPISLGTRLGLGGGQATTSVTPEATAGATESAALPQGVTLTTVDGAAVGVSRVAAADLAAAGDGALAAAAAALSADALVGDAYVLDFTGDAPTPDRPAAAGRPGRCRER